MGKKDLAVGVYKCSSLVFVAVSYPARVGQGPSSLVVVGYHHVWWTTWAWAWTSSIVLTPLVAADSHSIIGDHLLKSDSYDHLEAPLVTEVVYLALEATLHETSDVGISQNVCILQITLLSQDTLLLI